MQETLFVIFGLNALQVPPGSAGVCGSKPDIHEKECRRSGDAFRQFASTCGTESIRGCRSSCGVARSRSTRPSASGSCAPPIPGTSTSRPGCARSTHLPGAAGRAQDARADLPGISPGASGRTENVPRGGTEEPELMMAGVQCKERSEVSRGLSLWSCRQNRLGFGSLWRAECWRSCQMLCTELFVSLNYPELLHLSQDVSYHDSFRSSQ